MAPVSSPPVPELLRMAGQRLDELAGRAEQLADAGTNCSHDLKVGQAVRLAKQVLEIPGPVR